MYSWDELEQAVGRNMPNLPPDVRKVRDWLDRWTKEEEKSLQEKERVWAKRVHQAEQQFSDELHRAIQEFQRRVLGHPAPSGKVHPGDDTARKLKHPPRPNHPGPKLPPGAPVQSGPLPAHPAPGTPLVLPKRRGYDSLSVKDYDAAAKDLGCESRVIRALAMQEGKDHGFDSSNRPVILWEPKHFALLSHHAALYRKKYPVLTHLKPKPHVYGLSSQQYVWLSQAYLINPHAALLTPSWGKFQILGSGSHEAGYASVELFVAAMCDSEQTQLAAFVQFIKSKGMQKAMQDKDWKGIAAGYNGKYWYKRMFGPPGHQITYDQSLEDNYNSITD